jgi:hypothetical protein
MGEDMGVELVVALIAGTVALVSAGGTIWSSIRNAEHSGANAKAIEQLKIDNDRLKTIAQRQREISNFSEPLARAAYDLQSRLYNILKQNLIEIYLVGGNDRETSYVTNNTAFLVGQYLCWSELVRKEIQFIDLGESKKTRELLAPSGRHLQHMGNGQTPPAFPYLCGRTKSDWRSLHSDRRSGARMHGIRRFPQNLQHGSKPTD